MLSPALKSFHDETYVLTIPSATERHESVRTQLGDGCFTFLYGIDKETVTKSGLAENGMYDEARAIRLDRNNEPMTLGHICCSLGHSLIYRDILEKGHDRALIFEDDVIVETENERFLHDALANVPKDADLIYWGWEGGENVPRLAAVEKQVYKLLYRLGQIKLDPVMAGNLYRRPFNEHFDIAGKHFLAHAYTVTRNCAEKLLLMNTPVVLNADKLLTYAILRGEIKAYISLRKFFAQGSNDPNSNLSRIR
jgi:GR25 family glycosyltransferase involved in LPS biosynthesis